MAKKNMFEKYIDTSTSKSEKEISQIDSPNLSDGELVSNSIGSGDKPEDIDLKRDGDVNALNEMKIAIPKKLPFPKSLLPWPENSTEYTNSLLGAGYTSIQNIATASIGEIQLLTIIPDKYIKQLIDSARSWGEYQFNTAATLLENRANYRNISTGSRAVDKLLGGGIEPSGITEFYGAFTTGKTQMCTQLAVNTALPDNVGGLSGDVIYIDTEGSFRPERIVQMCKGLDVDPNLILSKIMIGRAHNTTMQMQLTNLILEYAETNNIKLVIVDSLTSNFRSEYIGKGAIIERQQKLNQHLQQLSRISDLLQVAIVVTNQVMAVMGVEDNQTQPIGGNILAHGSTHRIELSKSRRHSTHRNATLIASPSQPEGTASFKILETGIHDI